MSKYTIDKELNSLYAQRRFEAEQNLDDRLQAALQIHEFKSLYVERKALSLEIAKNSTPALQQEFVKISKQILDVINKNNIDLNIYYACPKCKDTGYVDGKACDCRLKMSRRLLRAESNLPSFATATFENTSYNKLSVKQKEPMTKIYSFCKKWAENIDIAKKRVVPLMGSVGIGKTTVAFCVANKLLDLGHSVYYATAFDLSTLIIDKQFNRLQNVDDYYNMLDADLLIIDDLGTEPQNTLMQEGLFAILDSRINENKKTMVCTNLTQEQFSKRYGARSESRLTCTEYAVPTPYIDGSDLRKIKC